MKLHELQRHLNEVISLLAKNEDDLKRGGKVLQSNSVQEVRGKLSESLPIKPLEFSTVLEDFSDKVLPFINHNTSPLYSAYITGSGSKIGAIAEFIKGYFNQNGLKWNNSPVAAEMEKLVIKWIADFLGLSNFHHGVLLSGGSMSNFMAIHFAITNALKNREQKGLMDTGPVAVYCSEEAHSSIERAMVFLGLGRQSLRKVPVDRECRIEVNQLAQVIKKDIEQNIKPIMIIGTAGTTNTGSVDDLLALGEMAKKYKLWYHVDGAYGIPAIRSPLYQKLFDGAHLADSVTINPHKWMYVPFEASCILVKEFPQAFTFSPNYLLTEGEEERWESSQHTVELSKEFRALKIWFTLKYYGADKISSFIEHDIYIKDVLLNLLDERPHFEVHPAAPLSIVCFRVVSPSLNKADLNDLNLEILRRTEKRGNIFLTGTSIKGTRYLRFCFIHPERKKEDLLFMINEIETVAKIVEESTTK